MSIEVLAGMMGESRYTVFFGGAGMSTESGIPDFRGAQGLFRQGQPSLPPERVLSHGFFMSHPRDFYDYYRAHLVYPGAQPNAGHRALARLEQAGRLQAVVTQNVDGLHQAAGSQRVFELHGSVYRNHCMGCGRSHDLAAVMDALAEPHCPCGGLIRPNVVLYDEQLPGKVWEGAVGVIGRADLLIVGGTSLSVYPAAGLVEACPGKIVLINNTPTPYDDRADLVLRMPVGTVLEQAAARVLGDGTKA